MECASSKNDMTDFAQTDPIHLPKFVDRESGFAPIAP